MNSEHRNHKTGLQGELLVRIVLNDLGINTGSVDRDSGTDIVMFYNGIINTAQVKTGLNSVNENNDIHGVRVHFRVELVSENERLVLGKCKIQWRDVLENGPFITLDESIKSIFNQRDNNYELFI